MDTKDYFEWLKKENLYATVEKNYPIFETVLKRCLDVKQREEVLILGDQGFPARRCSALMLGCYLMAAKRSGLKHKFALQAPKERGDEAEDQIVESVLNMPEGNVIIWGLSGRIGAMPLLGKSFRKFVQSHQHRFISAPSLGLLKTAQFKQVASAINVDHDKMIQVGKDMKEKFDVAKEVHITTDKGTDLFVDVTLKNAISNDGIYDKPGMGGNMPAGEVYMPPRKKGVSGKVVIDGCSRNVRRSILCKHPITLTVDQGKITQIEGKEEAKELEQTLQWAEDHAKYPWGIRMIGELGVGMNPNAALTESTLLSEKTLGTAHIAIGSNYWFGGTIFAIIHLDQVFKNPNIWLDDEKLNVG